MFNLRRTACSVFFSCALLTIVDSRIWRGVSGIASRRALQSDDFHSRRNLQQDSSGDQPEISLSRLFNGVPAGEGEFPYIVSLKVIGQHACGGVLIAPNVVLTAAHCAVDVSGRRIPVDAMTAGIGLLGVNETKETRPTVEEFQICRSIMHKQFDGTNVPKGFDIALLVLNGSSKAEAAEVDMGSIPLDEGTTLTTAGFGRINSMEAGGALLKTEKLQNVPIETCEEAFQQELSPSSTICVLDPEGSDVCKGDSGGPLLTTDKKTVVGIVSLGAEDCTSIETPSLVTRVSSFTDFIIHAGGEDGDVLEREGCPSPEGALFEVNEEVPTDPEAEPEVPEVNPAEEGPTEPEIPPQETDAAPDDALDDENPEAVVTAENIVAAVAEDDVEEAADLILKALEQGNVQVIVDAMELAVAEGDRGAALKAITKVIQGGVALETLFPALEKLNT